MQTAEKPTCMIRYKLIHCMHDSNLQAHQKLWTVHTRAHACLRTYSGDAVRGRQAVSHPGQRNPLQQYSPPLRGGPCRTRPSARLPGPLPTRRRPLHLRRWALRLPYPNEPPLRLQQRPVPGPLRRHGGPRGHVPRRRGRLGA